MCIRDRGNPCPDDLSPTLSDLMGKIMMENPITPDGGILHHPEGVDLVPSNIELSGMEVALVNACLLYTSPEGSTCEV